MSRKQIAAVIVIGTAVGLAACLLWMWYAVLVIKFCLGG
jgi:hypothetical protein